MSEPRLALVPDAVVRTYVGEEGWGWVVVRRRAPRVRLDLCDRVLVDLADGSRTPPRHRRDAIDRLGRLLLPREFDERVAALVEAGVLRDAEAGFEDLDPTWPPNLVQARLPDGATPRLVIAEGVRLGCDGRGGCCRLYDRVDVGVGDVVRLQAAWPGEETTPGGLTVESALRPVRGAPETFSLAARDGACVLLEEDGRCAVHARLGAAAKPAGCATFPLRDVLAGDELHVGIATECRCALDFARDERAPPLELAARALLDRRLATRAVEAIAPEVAMTCDRFARRDEYLAWRAGAMRRLDETRDACAWALDEAAALVGGAGGRPWRSAPLIEAMARIAGLLDDEARDTARVYSAGDLQRAAFAWGAAAAARLRERLSEGDGPEPPLDDAGERLVAGQALFAHGLLRARSLGAGLVALAARLALARSSVAEALPPELAPLSTADYLFRAHAAGDDVDLCAPALDDALRSA